MTEEEPKRPYRKIRLMLDADADSWEDMRFILRDIEMRIVTDGSLSAWGGTGGVTVGYTFKCNITEGMTTEKYHEANDAYLTALRQNETESK